MMTSEIKHKVREIIASVLEIQPVDIPETPGLPYELSLDSLMILEILVAMEHEFQITIDEQNALDVLDSLDNATMYLDKKLSSTVG